MPSIGQLVIVCGSGSATIIALMGESTRERIHGSGEMIFSWGVNDSVQLDVTCYCRF